MEKLKELALRYDSLQAQLTDPSVYENAEKLREINLELKRLAPVAEAVHALEIAQAERTEAEELLQDPEMRDLAQEEFISVNAEITRLNTELKQLLLKDGTADQRNVVVEIRAGVGGEESALFANSLLRMYCLYAEKRGWKIDIVNRNETELGGIKECSFLVEGADAYARLQFESGVHRVQRVPATESGGRIHTSAVTVAVLPEAEDVEFYIDPKDLQIDTYRSSGAGGQHVNKTESAIRITHLPSGMVVECQDERSQYKNKDKAMKVLRSRLLEAEKRKRADAEAAQRKIQVGSGDRSERIRTYNFPQGRVTDHRINLTIYRIDAVMNGDLDEILDALIEANNTARLEGTKEA